MYAREDAEDDRFSDHFGSLQSIVTSTAQNDSGLFETNLRDERFLPFEGSGAISEWQLELPADEVDRQFDYDTIADVILHIRYTAREGAGCSARGAVEHLKDRIAKPSRRLGAAVLGPARVPDSVGEVQGGRPRRRGDGSADARTAAGALSVLEPGRLEAITRAGVCAMGGAAKFSVVANADGTGRRTR